MGLLGAHFFASPIPPSGEPLPPSPLTIENLMDAGKASGGLENHLFWCFFLTNIVYFRKFAPKFFFN